MLRLFNTGRLDYAEARRRWVLARSLSGRLGRTTSAFRWAVVTTSWSETPTRGYPGVRRSFREERA